MFRFQINNMLRIESATIELRPGCIASVSGPNAAGKTSLATIIGALAADQHNPANAQATRRKVYLRDDCTAGNAAMLIDGKPANNWDAVENNWVNSGNASGSTTGPVGLVDFCATSGMPSKARAEIWRRYFEPEYAVMRNAVKEQLEAILQPGLLNEVMEYMDKRPSGDGIDMVHNSYAERVRTQKSAWQSITGEIWGIKKGADWLPEGWHPGITGVSEADAQSLLDAAKMELEGMFVQAAITTSQIADAKVAKEQLPEIQKTINSLTQQIEDKKTSLTELLEAKKEVQIGAMTIKGRIDQVKAAEPTAGKTLTCPGCEARLLMQEGKLIAFDDEAFRLQLKKHKEQLAELESERVGIDADIQKRNEPINNLKRDIQELMEQRSGTIARKGVLERQAQLAEDNPIESNEAEIKRHENELELARKNLELVKARAKAQRHHEQIIEYQHILTTLGTKGVRSIMIQEKMSRFSAILQTLRKITDWPQVAVDQSYSITIDGRTMLRVCAESERLRAQYLLQVALARLAGEPLIILDCIDHLDESNQKKLMKMLNAVVGKDARQAILICGTELDPALNPDGDNFRIADGKLEVADAA